MTDKPVVLVTGAGGQLGYSLKKLYREEDRYQWVFLGSSDLNITDAAQIEAYFKKLRPQYCINCAAYTNVRAAEEHPEEAFKVNAEAVKTLAGICRDHQCVLLHISTDYVFDGTKRTPYRAEDQPNPLNVYGRSKLKGEEHLATSGADFYLVRTSWLYHPEFGQNFYRTILNRVQQGGQVMVTRAQLGTPTHAENLAAFLFQLITHNPAYGIYHYSDGEVMSWYDLARKILSDNGVDLSLLTEGELGNDPVNRPVYSALKPDTIS